jgi:hypothetical protein
MQSIQLRDELTEGCDSEMVHQIFEPLITAIVQLVAEQVANVRIKRMGANHPKGKEIKVR